MHINAKKAARFLLPPSGSRNHRSGKPKSLRCSFQSSGIFFIICAMDNPSGSAPATIASTMSGARLFKPRTRVTYGGFKPSEALGTHCNRNVVPDAFCRFRAALCSNPAWDHIFLPFRNVFPRRHCSPDCHLVVSRINSPQLRLTLLIKSAFLFKVHLVIWNLSSILHFEQFCVHLNFC